MLLFNVDTAIFVDYTSISRNNYSDFWCLQISISYLKWSGGYTEVCCLKCQPIITCEGFSTQAYFAAAHKRGTGCVIFSAFTLCDCCWMVNICRFIFSYMDVKLYDVVDVCSDFISESKMCQTLCCVFITIPGKNYRHLRCVCLLLWLLCRYQKPTTTTCVVFWHF